MAYIVLLESLRPHFSTSFHLLVTESTSTANHQTIFQPSRWVYSSLRDRILLALHQPVVPPKPKDQANGSKQLVRTPSHIAAETRSIFMLHTTSLRKCLLPFPMKESSPELYSIKLQQPALRKAMISSTSIRLRRERSTTCDLKVLSHDKPGLLVWQ